MAPRSERSRDETLALGGAVAAAVLGAFAAALVGPWSLVVVGLALAAVTALVVVARPWLGFAAYLVLLAPHVLLMALLYAVVGLPATAVRAASAWKEGLLLLLLLTALVRAVQRPRHVVALPDLLVAAYTAWACLVGLLSLARGVPLTALAYGMRDALLPVLVYLVGRALPLSETRARWVLRLLLVVGLALAALGIVERQLIPTELHVAAGIPRYYREILGYQTFDYLMGLPANYWTSANSGLLRRAVSVYGSSQPFALSFLLFLPAAGYVVLSRGLPERRLAIAALAVMLVGLALTITRFTIMIGLAQLLLMGLILSPWARRIAWRIAGVAAAAFVAVLVVVPPVRLLVINTLTFQDHSSAERLQVWGATLELIAANPAGYGLAATGQTATRFGGAVINIEGQYSKIGVEQGLVGLLLYILVLGALSFYLLRQAAREPGPYRRAIAVTVAIALVGLAVNSMTTEWHNSIALVYPVWWLAGAAVASVAVGALERRTR